MSIGILVMLHSCATAFQKILFQEMIYNIHIIPNKIGNHDIIKKVVYDEDTEIGSLKRLIPSEFELEHGPNTEWEKCEFGFDSFYTDYVAICHQDDYWIKDKLQVQLKYMQPESSVVVTSYIQTDLFLMNRIPITIQIPLLHYDYGIIQCVPSTWMINKNIIKKLPNPFPYRPCKDLGILYSMGQSGPIEVVRVPYVIYHNHHENGWNTVGSESIEQGKNALKRLVKEYPKPVLKYHWS